ncbi:MAG: hypothetical protein QOH10_163, partial [Actinomycetota bacterium]|nr:hypothetical protein [Actinomycetota bacterium]
SVTGVKTLGVLHAPGYPSYVAVANAFAKVVALGGWAARVNAFSLVCAALTIGAVYLLARSFGASPLGSALGAFVLATSASFWFNAAYAKHYAFSGLVVTLAALAVAQWQSGGRSTWFIVAGVLLGAGAGSSWEIAVIMAAGLALLVIFGTRRPGPTLIAGSIAALVIVTVGAYSFMVWRARQHPAVNWGEVTNLHRLVTQVTQQDFHGQADEPTHGLLVVRMASRVPHYFAIVERDLGLGAVLLALVGAIFGIRSLDRGRKLFLAAVAALNFGAVVFASTRPSTSSAVAGIDHISGFVTGLLAGGYLLDLLIVIAVLAAVGTTPLVEWAAAYAVGRSTPARYRSSAASEAHRYRSGFTVALVVMVLAPSILVHYRYANHRQPPFADRYAHRVLAALPPHAALVVLQADHTFPLVYRQAVFGDRPDVSIVITTSLQFGWYREQLERTVHLPSPVRAGSTDQQVYALIAELRKTRPVFIDTGMMASYQTHIPFRLRGLVAEVVNGRAETSIDRGALAATLIRNDRSDGIAGHAYLRYPNVAIQFLYARAHIELAKEFAAAHELEPARTELARALDDFPDDSTTTLVLKFSRQPEEKPADVERVIQGL